MSISATDASQTMNEQLEGHATALAAWRNNGHDEEATKAQLDGELDSASSNLYDAKNNATQDGTVDAQESQTIDAARSEYNIARYAAGVFG